MGGERSNLRNKYETTTLFVFFLLAYPNLGSSNRLIYDPKQVKLGNRTVEVGRWCFLIQSSGLQATCISIQFFLDSYGQLFCFAKTQDKYSVIILDK